MLNPMCAFRRYQAVVAELQVQVEKQRKELAAMRAVGVGQFDRFGRVRIVIRCFSAVPFLTVNVLCSGFGRRGSH